MYFISEVLSDSKTRYPQIQKLPYAILIAKRKLRHCFESHPVTVVTFFPLGEAVQENKIVSSKLKELKTSKKECRGPNTGVPQKVEPITIER